MSKKRELLLNTALELFYSHGVNSIGINEVLKVSGVAKRTLYSHFESKDELVLAALKQRHQVFMEWLELQVENSRSDSEFVERLFDSLESWFLGQEAKLGDFRGCFFINTSAEFSDLDSEISQYCCYHKEQVRELIQKRLSTNSSELTSAICLVKEGAITTAYMTGNVSEVIKNSKGILRQLQPVI